MREDAESAFCEEQGGTSFDDIIFYKKQEAKRRKTKRVSEPPAQMVVPGKDTSAVDPEQPASQLATPETTEASLASIREEIARIKSRE